MAYADHVISIICNRHNLTKTHKYRPNWTKYSDYDCKILTLKWFNVKFLTSGGKPDGQYKLDYHSTSEHIQHHLTMITYTCEFCCTKILTL